MKNSHATHYDRPSWFSFLRLEAELALTFIQTASTYNDQENGGRTLQKARKALSQIRRGLNAPSDHGLTEDQIVFLETSCAKIELALGNSIRGSMLM